MLDSGRLMDLKKTSVSLGIFSIESIFCACRHRLPVFFRGNSDGLDEIFTPVGFEIYGNISTNCLIENKNVSVFCLKLSLLRIKNPQDGLERMHKHIF